MAVFTWLPMMRDGSSSLDDWRDDVLNARGFDGLIVNAFEFNAISERMVTCRDDCFMVGCMYCMLVVSCVELIDEYR